MGYRETDEVFKLTGKVTELESQLKATEKALDTYRKIERDSKKPKSRFRDGYREFALLGVLTVMFIFLFSTIVFATNFMVETSDLRSDVAVRFAPLAQ